MQEPSSCVVHEGPVFSVETLTYEDPGCGVVRKDIVRHPGAVLVIPLTAGGNLLMIRNHRVSVDCWVLEFCAGKLEAGEPPHEAARRELAEECGREAGELLKVGSFLTSPGFCDERMHVYEARNLSETPRRLEPGERIEVVEMGIDDLEARIREGDFDDGKSMAAYTLWKMRSGRSGRGVR
ncbi:MAG: NUDIX hydrolase [Phycisphaerales bacterium]|nr:NUDIX hydrolase [Phycisphaerales bacterium]